MFQFERMYPAAMITDPRIPIQVRVLDVTHLGWRAASQTSALCSAAFRIEVWILRDAFTSSAI
jgi:hypothetical protein